MKKPVFCFLHLRPSVRVSSSLLLASVGSPAGQQKWAGPLDKCRRCVFISSPTAPPVTLGGGVILFGGALILLRASASEKAFHQTQPSVSYEALESAETLFFLSKLGWKSAETVAWVHFSFLLQLIPD